MGCRESVNRLMREVGIYRFPKEGENLSLIQCELEAYFSVLEPLEKRIQALGGNSFLIEAEEGCLRRFERMLGIPVNGQVSLETRRRMALERFQIGPNDFSLEGIKKALRAAGLEAIVRENPGSGVLTIIAQETADRALNLEEARKAVKQFLPAHLEADFQTGGLTWNELAGLNWSWASLEGLSKCWDEWEVTNLEDLQA